MKVDRLHSLDAMRGILMVLGIYYHIAFFNYMDDSIFFGIFFHGSDIEIL